MARFKYTDRKQGRILPVTLEEQLIPGTLEHSIDLLVDKKLDLTDLEAAYKNENNGASAYHPKDLLKVLFAAFLRGIYSTRKIERLCQENMVFMALSGDHQPDHATIARFILKLEPYILSFFEQILLYCDSLDLLSGTSIAIDGCKIPSNAAKDSSGTFAELEKKKEKFQKIASDLIERSKSDSSKDFEKRAEYYEEQVDRISTFLNTHEKRIGQRKREVKSNITDNDSAKLTGGHGVIQGYYALAAVDEKHQIITSAKAVGTQNERQFLKDMIITSQKLLPNRITKETTILADTGYFSEENCRFLLESGQRAVVPDNHFRQRDPRFNRDPEKKDRNPRRKNKGLFGHDVFTYDSKNNRYTCPARKNLKFDGVCKMHGHVGRRYVQKDGDCNFCHLKSQCLQSNAKRRNLFIVDVPKPMTFSNRMKKIIDSKEGKLAYSKRMGIVEPVFANITHNKGLKRFRYRGLKKVNTLWTLYCMVHNIEKIHKYGNKE